MTRSTTHSAQWHQRPQLGIALYLLNVVMLATLGAVVKELSARYPLGELLAFRFAIAALLFTLALRAAGGIPALATRRPGLHAVRTASGIVSLGLLFVAIAHIPLAETSVLINTAPFFVVIFSIPLLGETIGFRRWAAVLLGFCGVLLIAQPGGLAIGTGLLAAIGSALFAALVTITVRMLSRSETTATIGFYYNACGALVYTLSAWLGDWALPATDDYGLFLVFGILAAAQQWAVNHAPRFAEASLLAPLQYLSLVFSAVLGFVFWGEIPAQPTWVGAALIVTGGLFILARKRHKDTSTCT